MNRKTIFQVYLSVNLHLLVSLLEYIAGKMTRTHKHTEGTTQRVREFELKKYIASLLKDNIILFLSIFQTHLPKLHQ